MKKLLLSLFAILGLGLSFTSAGSFTDSGTVIFDGSTSDVVVAFGSYPYSDFSNYSSSIDYSCTFTFDVAPGTLHYYLRNVYLLSTSILSSPATSAYTNGVNASYTFNGSVSNGYFNYGYVLYFVSVPNTANFTLDYVCTFTSDDFIGSTSSCDYSDYELKSDITQLYCQNKFDTLITSQQCDSQYSGYVSSSVYSICTNSLDSLSSELSVCNMTLNSCLNGNYTGDVQWSALYINNIQHLSAPLINVDIPDNIYWDYSVDENEFNLYVGSGYDQEYIDSVISINSYRPTSEDFTSIFVGGLTLIFPYLIFALFILFLRKLIKRIFK